MSIELAHGDFTGVAEQDWILATLREINHGRAWPTGLPKEVKLPTERDDRVKPYYIARFATPAASTQGRSIAGGEQAQPHLLNVTVLAIAGDDEWARDALVDASRVLTGKAPSLTSTVLQARGGSTYGSTNNTVQPVRFERAGFWRCTINV